MRWQVAALAAGLGLAWLAGCERKLELTGPDCSPEAVRVGGHGLYQRGDTYLRFRYTGGASAAELGRDFPAVKESVLDPVHAGADFSFYVEPDSASVPRPPFRTLSIAANMPGALRVLYDVKPMAPVSRWRQSALPADTRFAAVAVDSAGRVLRLAGSMEVLHAWPLDLRFYLVALEEQPEVVINGVLTFAVVSAPCPAPG